MAKKKVETQASGRRNRASSASSERVHEKETAARASRSAKDTAKAAKPRKTRSAASAKPPMVHDGGATNLDAILEEVRGVRRLVESMAVPTRDMDASLDASVDSLRRLLSELIEERMESVVRSVVDVRREAANLNGQDGTALVEHLDRLLEDLGAIRFEAEPMDIVDPVIHTVIDERHHDEAPEGVILETVRPGFRTARGLVVCKAAVAVNRNR